YLVRGTDVRHMGLKRMREEVEGTKANVESQADDN
ncbi:phosphate transport system regulator PhoU, partial [Pseudomonas sp. FSL R10-0071]|nr:phosphate transport system regulator PhoU [Pseudomonas sp. FSL R10-0071]